MSKKGGKSCQINFLRRMRLFFKDSRSEFRVSRKNRFS
jgi:hypothetical protein